MTNYQSPSRNQRPRGLKVKQALQFALFLAICLWLLYQIKPLHNEKKKQDKNVQTKLRRDESKTVVLGRKGNAAWFSDRKTSMPEDANLMGNMVNNDGGDTRNEKDAEGGNYHEKKDIAALDQTEMHDSNIVLEKYEAVEENGEDKLSAVNQEGVVNVTIPEYSFNDENGIPQHLAGAYQKLNLHHSKLSTSKNASKLAEKKAVVGGVESKQDLTAYVQD